VTQAAARHESLAEALEALREKGLRRGVAPRPGDLEIPAIPTGQPRLDAALGTGGWPRGSLALLDAPLGSGAATLALGSMASCQGSGGLCAWLDLPRTFDPAVAAHQGVDLEWLLIARPADPAEALEIGAWLARSRLLDLLVLDFGTDAPGRGVDRLPQLLARTGGVALTLAPGAGERVARAAGVRLRLERRAWLAVGRDLVGQRVSATVARHRWALAGASAELDLWFAEGRRIDPLLRSAAAPADGSLPQPGLVPLADPLAVPLAERPALRSLSA
jgi:RecA/RadA recombinase